MRKNNYSYKKTFFNKEHKRIKDLERIKELEIKLAEMKQKIADLELAFQQAFPLNIVELKTPKNNWGELNAINIRQKSQNQSWDIWEHT